MKFPWKNTMRWTLLTFCMGIAIGFPLFSSYNTSIIITILILATFVWKDIQTQWRAIAKSSSPPGNHNIYYIILALASYFVGFGGSGAVYSLILTEDMNKNIDMLSFALAAIGLGVSIIIIYMLKKTWESIIKQLNP